MTSKNGDAREIDGSAESESDLSQPLTQPVPSRIWLMDLGGGDIVWSAERDPDGEQVDAVEYVRVGQSLSTEVKRAFQAGWQAGGQDAIEPKYASIGAVRFQAAWEEYVCSLTNRNLVSPALSTEREVERERAIRIILWNTLKDKGVGECFIYPAINDAAPKLAALSRPIDQENEGVSDE